MVRVLGFDSPVDLNDIQSPVKDAFPEKEIIVQPKATNFIYIQFTSKTLNATLVQKIRGERANEVIIRGDTSVNYGAVVKLIDVCNQAGVNNINLNTIPEVKNEH